MTTIMPNNNNLISKINDQLPFELANIIYSYLGQHPVAELVQDYWGDGQEFCSKCEMYVPERVGDTYRNCHADGTCEYCHAEQLGIDVYTCEGDCCTKTYNYTDFNNMYPQGLYCDECLDGFDACYMCGETDWDGEHGEDDNGNICQSCADSWADDE